MSTFKVHSVDIVTKGDTHVESRCNFFCSRHRSCACALCGSRIASGNGLVLEGPVGGGATNSGDSGMQFLGMAAKMLGSVAGVNVPSIPGLTGSSYQSNVYGNSYPQAYPQTYNGYADELPVPPRIQTLYDTKCRTYSGEYVRSCIDRINRKISQAAANEGRTFRCVGQDGRIFISQRFRAGCTLSY